MAATADSLASGGVAHERFTGQEANRRYPHQLRLPNDCQCVFEEGGSILYSQRAVLAFQVQIPCVLWSNERHLNIFGSGIFCVTFSNDTECACTTL